MSDTNEGTQLVQMRLKPKTIERIDSLGRRSGTSNRTQVVANAIQFTEVLSEYIHSGAQIYVEKDGKRELLKIVGI